MNYADLIARCDRALERLIELRPKVIALCAEYEERAQQRRSELRSSPSKGEALPDDGGA